MKFPAFSCLVSRLILVSCLFGLNQSGVSADPKDVETKAACNWSRLQINNAIFNNKSINIDGFLEVKAEGGLVLKCMLYSSMESLDYNRSYSSVEIEAAEINKIVKKLDIIDNSDIMLLNRSFVELNGRFESFPEGMFALGRIFTVDNLTLGGGGVGKALPPKMRFSKQTQ